MGSLIDVPRPDGGTTKAYLAEPKGRASGPGVVVLQEWWGLNEQIKTVADRLAAEGYRALVPDLYHGKVAQDGREAGHLMQGLDFASATHQDVCGAARYLKASGKVAVMGFCMGGALTLIAAAKLAEVDGAVCFYGIPKDDAADLRRIRVPVLLHFAARDGWCTPQLIAKLEAKLTAGKVPYTLYRYEAEHAFMNQTRREVYDQAAAEHAWARTLAFLKGLT